MSYFLAPQSLRSGQTLTLEGEEASHLLKSRRLRAGDVFALQDGDGRRYAAEVLQVSRDSAVVRTMDPLPVPALPPVQLWLLCAAVKEKALEWILQKSTELGVAEIVVFPAEHSPVAEEDLNAPKTVARWERILREACKQSDRQFPPRLRVAADLAGAIALSGGADLRLTLDPRAGTSAAQCLAEAAAAKTAAVLIGPEGGLSEAEVSRSQLAGFRPATLGGLILRADTAAIAMAALVLLGRARSAE
jgi:16S rRNA (uracil1498-N3)-methyltransferase